MKRLAIERLIKSNNLPRVQIFSSSLFNQVVLIKCLYSQLNFTQKWLTVDLIEFCKKILFFWSRLGARQASEFYSIRPSVWKHIQAWSFILHVQTCWFKIWWVQTCWVEIWRVKTCWVEFWRVETCWGKFERKSWACDNAAFGCKEFRCQNDEQKHLEEIWPKVNSETT